MVEFEMEPQDVRKRVSGTILADLYDGLYMAVKDDYNDNYWPQKYVAEIVAGAYNSIFEHGMVDHIPKSRREA